MRNKIFLIFLILVFLALNFFSLKSYFYNYLWEKSFANKNFEEAKKYFSNAWNDFWKYNLWVLAYKNWNFEEAKNIFENLKTWENKDSVFLSNFSLWNVYYRIWDKTEDKEQKKQNWLQSISYYEEALNIKKSQEIEKNIEFIKNKLNELEQNQEETEEKEQQQWEKQNSWSWSNNDEKQNQENSEKSEGNNQNSQKQDDKMQNQEKNWQNKSQENQKNLENKSSDEKNWQKMQESDKIELSEEEKKALEDYEKYLKKVEKTYSSSFDKKKQNDFSDDIFWDAFFEDPFSGKNSHKKDW